MKLTVKHMAILRAVRERLELIDHHSYLCFCIDDICRELRDEELSRWYNHVLFWRRWGIREKWVETYRELSSGVLRGINFKATFGAWLAREMEYRDIVVPEFSHHNERLYKLGRLAWLDRALETGELK